MILELNGILKTLQLKLTARREARLKAFVAAVVADCWDRKRQAECLARSVHRTRQRSDRS